MNYSNPTIPLITNPVNLDRHIQAIQQKIAALPWIGKSFGRAYVAPSTNGLIPEMYIGGGEYYPLTPNDHLKSFAFFLPEGTRTYHEYTNTGGFHDANLNLICYGNLFKIDPVKQYYFAEELLVDALEIIRDYPGTTVIGSFDSLGDVYKGFYTKDIEIKLLKHPHFGFRILFNIKFLEDC